jgi:hypothetical protein
VHENLTENSIVMCIPIVSQLLGKHILAGAKVRKNMTSIARQRINKDDFLTIEAVFDVIHT